MSISTANINNNSDIFIPLKYNDEDDMYYYNFNLDDYNKKIVHQKLKKYFEDNNICV